MTMAPPTPCFCTSSSDEMSSPEDDNEIGSARNERPCTASPPRTGGTSYLGRQRGKLQRSERSEDFSDVDAHSSKRSCSSEGSSSHPRSSTSSITTSLKSLFGDGNVSGVKLSDAIQKTEYERNLLLNDYVLSKSQSIGFGVTSQVKLAISLQHGQKFAVKILNKNKLLQNRIMRRRSSEDSDSAYREIAVLRKLDHPNIVKLMEVLDDPEEDYLYMVFELVPNGPIIHVPTAQPLSVDKTWKYFRDIIAGVEYLHANHIVHRDLKPDNMLVDEKDNVKISDFGTSIEWHYNDQVANPHCTPAFTAPESLSEEAYLQSGSAMDIWSVGITLYAMLTGNVPWRSSCYMGLIEEIKSAPVTLSPDIAGVDDNLRDLLRQLLDRNPRTRIDSYELKFHPWVTRDGQLPCAFRTRADSIHVSAHEVKTSVRKINRTESLMLLEQASHFALDDDDDDEADEVAAGEEDDDASDSECGDESLSDNAIVGDEVDGGCVRSSSQNSIRLSKIVSSSDGAGAASDEVNIEHCMPDAGQQQQRKPRSGRSSRHASGRSNASSSSTATSMKNGRNNQAQQQSANAGAPRFPCTKVNRFYSVPHNKTTSCLNEMSTRASVYYYRQQHQPSVIFEEKMSQTNSPAVEQAAQRSSPFDPRWKFISAHTSNRCITEHEQLKQLTSSPPALRPVSPDDCDGTNVDSGCSTEGEIANTIADADKRLMPPPTSPIPVATVRWSSSSPPDEDELDDQHRQQKRPESTSSSRRAMRRYGAAGSDKKRLQLLNLPNSTTKISDEIQSTSSSSGISLSIDAISDCNGSSNNNNSGADFTVTSAETYRALPSRPRSRIVSGSASHHAMISVVPTPDASLLIPSPRSSFSGQSDRSRHNSRETTTSSSSSTTTTATTKRAVVAPTSPNWNAGTRVISAANCWSFASSTKSTSPPPPPLRPCESPSLLPQQQMGIRVGGGRSSRNNNNEDDDDDDDDDDGNVINFGSSNDDDDDSNAFRQHQLPFSQQNESVSRD